MVKKVIPVFVGRCLNFLAYIAPAFAGRLGFKIFCYPARPKLRKHQLDFLNTAEKGVITVDNYSVRTFKWYSGRKKILFLHGWQSHSYRWKNYIERLNKNEVTVYTLDAPGHGLSSGSFLTLPLYSKVIEKFLLENEGIETIVGHSIGSFSALFTLHRLPLLPVKKLVLLAPPGEASEFIEHYRNTLQLNDNAVKRVLDHFQDVIKEDISYFSAPSFAENIRQPGLIIHDKLDADTSYLHAVNINKGWTNSKLILTEGLYHNLKSESVIDEVISFVYDRDKAEDNRVISTK